MVIALVLLLVAGLLPALPAGAAAAGADASVVKDQVDLTVRPDGVVHAKETIGYDFGSGTDDGLERTFVVRKHLDETRDRRFDVDDLRASSPDGAPVNIRTSRDDELLIATIGAGHKVSGRHTIVLEYDIRGIITGKGDRQELVWPVTGGWKVPVAAARVTVTADAALKSLNCFVGDLSSQVGCMLSSPTHTYTKATFAQNTLLPGEYLSVLVSYPAGTTKVAPAYERRHTLSTAFTVSKVTGGVLAGLLAGLLGGLMLLYHFRGRDARTVSQHAAEGDHAPVSGDSGEFEPPDGVRPGQIGTLVDEQADVIDVTATIVDLAVRGHLMIEELSRETYGRLDWRLRQLHAPVAELHPYELTLYESLFHGRETIRLSELGGTFAEELSAVRGELYDDMVVQGWFTRRPDTVRTRWTTAGIAVTVLGVLGTIGLALFTDLALIGLAGIIAGAAIAIGGQYMPAKTARGATVLAHMLGFRAYLFRGEASEEAPEGHRLELFSRYLPYAIVFDAVERWAATVADIGRGEEADHLYWYEGPAEWDLSDFAESMRSFTLSTSGAISATRQFRSM